MKGRNFLDAALLASALVLGAYLILTRGGPTSAELAERERNVLQAFLPEEIGEIRLTTKGSKSTVLRRDAREPDASLYRLGESGDAEADPAVISELISALDYAVWRRTLETTEGVDPSQFGFDAPELEVKVSAGPRSYRMVFGKEAPAPADSIYLRVEGTNVDATTGVVSQSLLEKLRRGEQEFRGSLLLPYSRRETSLLALRLTEGEIVLRADPLGFVIDRKKEGKPPLRADRTLTDLIFFQLARAKIETYLDEAPPNASRGALATITQSSPSGPTYTATIGGECPGGSEGSILAVRLQPERVVGCITRTVLPAFRIDTDRLYDRTATLLSPDEIDHVTVSFDEQAVDLIRSGAEFHLLSRESAVIPRESGDEFLETLATTRLLPLEVSPQGVVSRGSALLRGQIPATVASGNADDQMDTAEEFRLTLYSEPGEGEARYLKREDDGNWFEIPSEKRWAFSGHDGWARNRDLSSWEPEDLHKVRLRSPSGSIQEITRTDDGFELASDQQADPALSRQLFNTLSRITATRFLTPPLPRPTTGLIVTEFERRVEEPSRLAHETLWIGERTRGGYLAWSTFAEGTFVVARGVRDVIMTPLTSRSPVRAVQTDLDALTITSGGQRFAFERQGGMLRAAGGSATDDMVAPLTQALDEIEVVSAALKEPALSSPQRGTPEFIFEGKKTDENGTIQSFTVYMGGVTVWQGRSVLLAWVQGGQDTFLVSNASMSSLRDLL